MFPASHRLTLGQFSMAFNTSIGLESAVKVLDALMHGQVLIPGADSILHQPSHSMHGGGAADRCTSRAALMYYHFVGHRKFIIAE